MSGEEMLRGYLRAVGLPENTEAEIGPFGDGEALAGFLLALILSGKKRGTCWACLGEEPPAPGSLTVITDWHGNAGCVVRTVWTRILPFSEVPWALARLEGENDDLAGWREEHARYFTREGRAEGYEFSGDMPVIFERFRVVWPPERADGEGETDGRGLETGAEGEAGRAD